MSWGPARVASASPSGVGKIELDQSEAVGRALGFMKLFVGVDLNRTFSKAGGLENKVWKLNKQNVTPHFPSTTSSSSDCSYSIVSTFFFPILDALVGSLHGTTMSGVARDAADGL